MREYGECKMAAGESILKVVQAYIKHDLCRLAFLPRGHNRNANERFGRFFRRR